MNGENFERMSRAMGAATSRRGLLGAFAGGIASLILGSSAAAPATAAAVICASDAECSAFERCLDGYCVAGVRANQPAPVSPGPCCQFCSRKMEGWASSCAFAPNPQNCYTVAAERYAACIAGCSETCR